MLAQFVSIVVIVYASKFSKPIFDIRRSVIRRGRSKEPRVFVARVERSGL
jgi:hypothetical protein